MLIRQETLAGIVDGRIELAFRRWKRPTVKAGGTLLTSVGQLAIDSVKLVSEDEVTDAEASGAGFESRAALLEMLGRKPEGQIYRVALRLAGPDPRVALRESIPDPAELVEIGGRLERWDRSSTVGAWTLEALTAISRGPGVRASELADAAGMEKARFKTNVRKLKDLGLTESLEVGYRLSPRGEAVLRRLQELRRTR